MKYFEEDFEIIGWPDIQYMMCNDGFEKNSSLIQPNEDIGIGSSTYIVSKKWIKSLDL